MSEAHCRAVPEAVTLAALAQGYISSRPLLGRLGPGKEYAFSKAADSSSTEVVQELLSIWLNYTNTGLKEATVFARMRRIQNEFGTASMAKIAFLALGLVGH